MVRSIWGPAAVVLAITSGGATGAAEAVVASRYIVFAIDESGAVKAQYQKLVTLASPRPERSEADLAAWLSATTGEDEHVAVRLIDASGRVAFRETVAVPRWLRTEVGLHGGFDGGSAANELLVPIPGRAFVVRVPLLTSSRLNLTLAQRGTAGLALRDGGPDLDLDLLAADSTLPLAGYEPAARMLSAPGPTSGNRVDLLVMGDGYTAAQSAKFASDAAGVLASFFSISPYDAYQNYFNVSTLFTASNQPGADHPPFASGCQATYPPTCCADTTMNSDPLRGTFADTAFDASYCTSNVHRLLAVTFAKAFAAAAASPDWDQILMVVNDSTYGGAGGGISVVSTHPQAVDVARHEFGHTFTRLADEYSYGTPPGPLCSDAGGPEACEANVTGQTSLGLLKWASWVLPTTPLPTPDTAAFATVVGLFEGARYRPTGNYRPQRTCLMNALGVPFCAICSQEFVLRLYRGGWGVPAAGIDTIEPGSETPAPGVVSLPAPATRTFSASLLQPVGGPALVVSWTVNGVAVPGATGPSYTFTPAAPGQYRVVLSVRDPTPLVRPAMAGSSLVHTRAWTLNVSPLGDLAITKRDDGSAKDGQPLVYTLVASNAGPDPVMGATVADTLPATIVGATWTCSASAGSSCPGAGPGSVSALVDLAGGGSATFTVTGTVAAGTARQIVNTASITAPPPFADINPANSSASITTPVARALSFHTIPPCRLVDTRGAQAPALVGATTRTFPVAGRCQVPVSAWAVSANMTVTQATEAGHLRAYPAGITAPSTSSLNYAAGQTRANNLTLFLSAAGEASIFCGQAAGTTHFLMDVNGYFE
jgi:uncharacterized repeat protein (TIGR01451 family)